MQQATIRRISEWANASEDEDYDQQYFYESSHYREILDSRKIIVIGRKGAGKTALAQQIVHTNRDGVLVTGVTLTTLQLPESIASGSALGTGDTLTKAWTNVILRSCANLMLSNVQLNDRQKKRGEDILGITAAGQKSNPLRSLRQFRLDAAFLGLEIGLHRPEASVSQSIEQNNADLFGFLEENLYARQLVIVFDGLDQGYIQAAADGKQPTYLRVIAALTRAAIGVKNHFKLHEYSRVVSQRCFCGPTFSISCHSMTATRWRSISRFV